MHTLQKIVWGIKIFSAVLVGFTLLSGIFESLYPASPSSTQYEFIKKELSHSDFDGYTTQQVLRVQPFQIVTLSNMAMGLMSLDKQNRVPRQELIPLIEEVKRRALSPHVSTYNPITPETDFTTGGIDGLYLSHLNVILGIDQYLHGAQEPDKLATAITKVLHTQSLAETDYHVPSFRHGDKWPADQAVTLMSLYVYDQINSTNYSTEPINKWLAFMHEKMVDPATGLYKSSIAERWYMDIPRGTALSWMILYMAQFAPQEAEQLYHTYRTVMWKEFLGLGGFREWPAGIDGHINIDTGPVVFDVGSAATALAIAPSKIMNDSHHYNQILRLFSILKIPNFSPLIGRTIIFNGETYTLWFSDYTIEGYADESQYPVLYYLAYVSIAVLICSCILFFDTVLLFCFSKIQAMIKIRKFLLK